MGDSLFKGTKAPICWPDRESQEICSFPGVKNRDISKRVTQLIKKTDYLLLLFNVGMNDTEICNMGRIK